jgi:hypothetical protein
MGILETQRIGLTGICGLDGRRTAVMAGHVNPDPFVEPVVTRRGFHPVSSVLISRIMGCGMKGFKVEMRMAFQIPGKVVQHGAITLLEKGQIVARRSGADVIRVSGQANIPPQEKHATCTNGVQPVMVRMEKKDAHGLLPGKN